MKLVILDRVGSLNAEGEESIVALKDWLPQEGALDAIAQLNRGGWYVALASNQPGLGRGSFDVTELNAIHARMHRELSAAGARVEAVFFCPHTPEDACMCRKPAAGLLEQITARYGAEPHEVWVVGQELVHLQAGERMGARLAWLVMPGAQSMPEECSHVRQYLGWQALADALAPDVQAPASESITAASPPKL